MRNAELTTNAEGGARKPLGTIPNYFRVPNSAFL